jgi:hypothetical protein
LNSPKKRAAKKGDPAVCVPPLRFGQPVVLGHGLRRRTRYAPMALRSNNCDEFENKAFASCGASASPRPARHRRSQKWEETVRQCCDEIAIVSC